MLITSHPFSRLHLFRGQTRAPVLLFIVLVATLLFHDRVRADTLPVSAVKIEAQQSYQVQRRYAGELLHVRSSQLGFEFGGIVGFSRVNEGDIVKSGDVLLGLATRSMEADLEGALARFQTAEANLVAQDAQLALSKSSLKRYEDLVQKGHGSAQRLDELQMQYRVDEASLGVIRAQVRSASAGVEMARANLAKFTIRAPYDGVIQARLVDEGSVVAPGQSVLTIVEAGRLEARIGIPEPMARRLVTGTSFPLKVADRNVTAMLKALLPTADAATGTVIALFEIEEPGLFAGTLAEVSLDVSVQEQGFWIPVSSLAESQRGLWSVMVVNTSEGKQTVEARLVEVLHRGDTEVYVRGTLRDGDLVVSGGTSRIVSGQEVQLANVR